MDAIWVAIITGGFAALTTVITVLASNKSSSAKMHEEIAVIKNDIKTLSNRVEKHNNLIERTYKLEGQVAELQHRQGGKQ